MKKLKFWNGRCRHREYHCNIAAYTQKQAIEILSAVNGTSFGAIGEIRDYFSQCWGDDMKGIEPTLPCAYIVRKYGDNPVCIVMVSGDGSIKKVRSLD